MNLRPKPVRVALLVIAAFALFQGVRLLVTAPPPIPPDWRPRTAFDLRNRKERGPEAEDVARPDPFPASLKPIASLLIQPASRSWKYIVVHHSAGPRGNAASIDEFHRTVNGWDGLAYHFVLGNGNGSPVGAVEIGFRWTGQLHGAHAGTKEHNEHGIGICVVGNYQETEFDERIYPVLLDLVTWLARRYGIRPERLLPHSAVRPDPTDCPGKNFPLQRLRDDLARALQR